MELCTFLEKMEKGRLWMFLEFQSYIGHEKYKKRCDGARHVIMQCVDKVQIKIRLKHYQPIYSLIRCTDNPLIAYCLGVFRKYKSQ